MEKMYKTFYSLSAAPFAKDSRCEAFESTSFQEATACLKYMLQVRGMGMLVGEPGAGKTFALRTFTASLHSSLYHTVYFPLATGTVSDFYRGLAYGLGEEPKTRKGDLFRQILKSKVPFRNPFMNVRSRLS
jgi:type II secretory pathway predicted ATPase ExeA